MKFNQSLNHGVLGIAIWMIPSIALAVNVGDKARWNLNAGSAKIKDPVTKDVKDTKLSGGYLQMEVKNFEGKELFFTLNLYVAKYEGGIATKKYTDIPISATNLLDDGPESLSKKINVKPQDIKTTFPGLALSIKDNEVQDGDSFYTDGLKAMLDPASPTTQLFLGLKTTAHSNCKQDRRVFLILNDPAEKDPNAPCKLLMEESYSFAEYGPDFNYGAKKVLAFANQAEYNSFKANSVGYVVDEKSPYISVGMVSAPLVPGTGKVVKF